MAKKSVLGALVAGLLAANGAAVWAVDSAGGHDSSKVTLPPPARPVVQLLSYGDCSQVLSGLRAEAGREVGPYGWGSGSSLGVVPERMPGVAYGAVSGTAAAAPVAAGSTSSAADGVAAGSAGYSTTNNQEIGVDEADITKTDGRLLVVLRSQPAGLEIADVSTPTPHLDSFLPVGGPSYADQGMFLVGDYAVVLADGQWSGDSTSSAPATTAYVVSLADPVHPAIVRSFEFQGSVDGARLIGDQVVLVLSNAPALPFVTPSDSSPGATSTATEANRSVIANAPLSDWLPGVRVSGGPVISPSCGDVVHPTVASGVGTVSVVSFTPTSTAPGHETTFVGNAETVYASTDAVYVASMAWADQTAPTSSPSPTSEAVLVPSPATNTNIYEFGISNPASPTFVASGQVPGRLIGQYALSEYQGYLRVATTVGTANPAPGEGTAPTVQSDSRVTVLAARDRQLVPVGRVTGLGRGEKIYAVRYEGPQAYVVTFNQIDPLYVLDLSHPDAPALDGAVELTGYSSFLQPLGGNLLFGIGRGVTSRMAPTDLQLSVFDVSNPRAPVLKSSQELPNSFSTAQDDPHALLWWPATRILAFPVADGQTGQVSVDVWKVAIDGTLSRASKLTPPATSNSFVGGEPVGGGAAGPPVASSGAAAVGVACLACGGAERVLVIGTKLYTVSVGGIMANDMTTWARDAWLPFSA